MRNVWRSAGWIWLAGSVVHTLAYPRTEEPISAVLAFVSIPLAIICFYMADEEEEEDA